MSKPGSLGISSQAENRGVDQCKTPGDVQPAGTRALREEPAWPPDLAPHRYPSSPSLHRTSLSAHEGPVWVLRRFSPRLSSQRASEPQLGCVYDKGGIFGGGTCSSSCGASWVFSPMGHWGRRWLRPQAAPFGSCEGLYSACVSLPGHRPPPPPQVMVSNPHSLGLQAGIYEDGYTYDGDTKHRLVSSLSCTRPAYPSRHPHQTRIFRLRGSALTCRCRGSPDDVPQGLTSVRHPSLTNTQIRCCRV